MLFALHAAARLPCLVQTRMDVQGSRGIWGIAQLLLFTADIASTGRFPIPILPNTYGQIEIKKHRITAGGDLSEIPWDHVQSQQEYPCGSAGQPLPLGWAAAGRVPLASALCFHFGHPLRALME